MDPALFAADLAQKPERLLALAQSLAAHNPWEGVVESAQRFVFLGMGSSAYAAGVAAARLTARGKNAISVLASTDLLPATHDGDLVIAISAGGGSQETIAAVDHYRDHANMVLLTNSPESPLAKHIPDVVDMGAGPEQGGVACRSFQHTLALLLALEGKVCGNAKQVPECLKKSAEASADLLDRAPTWLPILRELIDGPQGSHFVAPARRLSSAQQSALMLREGPRRQAYACETGDWSHVDVYLTKTTDYRMLLLAGSRWEDNLMRWVRERGSTVVVAGGDVVGTAMSLRYAHDADDDVRLISETLVAELLAADLWKS